MATYREITSSEVDADSPLTDTLSQAWTDNVLAIVEGDVTAPSIDVDAFKGAVAGSDTTLFRTPVHSVTGASDETVTEFIFGSDFLATTSGSVNVLINKSGAAGSVTLYKNGSSILTRTSNGSATIEVTYASGDYIYSNVKVNASSGSDTTSGYVIFRTTSESRYLGCK